MTRRTNHERSGPFAPPPLQGLHHYYEPVRQRTLHRYSTPHGFCRLERSLSCRPQLAADSSIRVRLPKFRTRAADQPHVTSTPDTTWPIFGHPPGSSRNQKDAPVSMPPSSISTRQQRSSCWSPPDTSTCMPSPHRSPRRSSTNAACGGLKPPPEGRLRRAIPSSLVQHRFQCLPTLFRPPPAFLAHLFLETRSPS